MKQRRILIAVLTPVLVLVAAVGGAYARGRQSSPPRASQTALGTAFTYQGQLKLDGEPVDEACQMAFRLYDAASQGDQVGPAITETVVITGGLFTHPLDFGAGAFTGDARWLGIQVMCPGDPGFDDLGRQALTAAPYALYARTAGDADLLDGQEGAAFWNTGGNAGTNPITDVLGTTDGVSLSLAVSGTTALRLVPAAGTPNVIGGYSGNTVEGGAYGATIGGGGASDKPNRVVGNYGTVGGGVDNTASGHRSTVSGGRNNVASAGWATVGGGDANTAGGETSTVSGGWNNTALKNRSTVGGGEGNTVSAPYAVIGGGRNNVITGTTGSSTIAGGRNNLITGTSGLVTIGGGAFNSASAAYATVPGGFRAEASHYGEMAYASGQFVAAGDAQTSVYVLRQTTTDGSWHQLYLDGSGECLTIPVSRTVTFDILLTAAADDGQAAAYHYVGGIKRTASGIALLDSVVELLALEDDPNWVVDVGAQDHYLRIRVTGAAGRTIRWVATVRTAETVMP